jgi:hypothetical protein
VTFRLHRTCQRDSIEILTQPRLVEETLPRIDASNPSLLLITCDNAIFDTNKRFHPVHWQVNEAILT